MADRMPAFWKPEYDIQYRDDGSILMMAKGDLPPIPRCLPDSLVKWAAEKPDQVFLAQRLKGGDWRKLTYREVLERVRTIAGGLLDMGLSHDRPILILSENSIEHALLGLAAQYAGIPYSPLSVAYSLVSTDYVKLKDIVALLKPGMVFVSDGDAYAPALNAISNNDHVVVAQANVPTGALDFADLATTENADLVEQAYAAITPQTVAKYLFTSGSTGSPKAVINSQAMLTGNQAIVADCFRFLADNPPVVVDWAPWNHTASGNKVFNMVLTNGGTFYIDEGKPTAKGMAETIRNLKEISPTWYFNVPAGYDMLISAMEKDNALRESFFSKLDMMMYAGAGMAQHTWDDLLRLSRETVGREVLLTTGLGATETGPFALQCTVQKSRSGNVGVPARGVTLKLVANGGKLEARVKSPSITPGYFGDAAKSAEMLDDEGFYCLGDALRPADPDDLTKGFFFDGRTAENFKLATGTWVAVGALRAAMVNHFGGMIRDVVIVGEGRDELGAILIPNAFDHDAKTADMATLGKLLESFAAQATGSSTRIRRAILIDSAPEMDKGEVTDKGSINQRAVMNNRPELIEQLYAGGTGVLRA